MDSVSGVKADVTTQTQIYALKKAEEAARNQMQTLLEALPNPQYNNPPNLGQNVDISV